MTLSLSYTHVTDPSGFEYVTCGSSIKLVHEPTRFRLHSHEIQYGGGSGQQSITATGARNDRNSYWLVKEGDGEAACSIGASYSVCYIASYIMSYTVAHIRLWNVVLQATRSAVAQRSGSSMS